MAEFGLDKVADAVIDATPQAKILTAGEVAALGWEPDKDEEE